MSVVEKTKSAAIALFDCIIAKRGKGAKGTVAVSTFGKPVKTKATKSNPNPGNVIKKWDYSHLVNVSETAMIEAVRKVAPLVEILARGADAIIKSDSIKGQGQTVMLAIEIFNAGLAVDADEAKKVAALWVGIRSDNEKAGLPVPSIEQLMALRKKQVDKLKATGQWATAKPKTKLVDNRPKTEPEANQPEPDETDEEEEDETDDSEEDTDEEETEE